MPATTRLGTVGFAILGFSRPLIDTPPFRVGPTPLGSRLKRVMVAVRGFGFGFSVSGLASFPDPVFRADGGYSEETSM